MPSEEIKNELTPECIRGLRQSLSTYLNSLPLLNPSAEITLTKRSLQRAFGWLGQTLKALGGTTPYTESENPASTKIEPTAEWSNENLLERWKVLEQTQTARVKDLRFILGDLIIPAVEEMKASYVKTLTMDPNNSGAVLTSTREVFISLTDAKMWLGWELREIKFQKERQERIAQLPAHSPMLGRPEHASENLPL